MRIDLIAVGQRMPAWVADGFNDFSRRLPRECSLHLTEIAAVQRGKRDNSEQAIRTEGERLLAAIPAGSIVIALDVQGETWSSTELARQFEEWLHSGGSVALLVGGADGLSQECLKRAVRRWSLSPLTLPHMLVRILVAEQLYRAWSILKNHPYHRA